MFSYFRLRLVLSPASSAGHAAAAFTGPRIRRVLGKAIVESFCPFGETLCQPRPQVGAPPPAPSEICQLALACPYGVLFAGSHGGRPPFALCAFPQAEDDQPDVLELTLYGAACRLYPWALLSLQRALRLGLGKQRHAWEIEEVRRVHPDRSEERLCGADLSELAPCLSPDLLGLTVEPYLAPQPVEITLLSPTRLLENGKLLPGHESIPLKLLVARILDRFRGLYGDEASEILDPRIRAAVESQAQRVKLLSDDTEWQEVADFSARARAELLLGGKVGRLVYGGDAAPFFPILRAGEVLHVGKNPTSGCGRIAVDLLPAR